MWIVIVLDIFCTIDTVDCVQYSYVAAHTKWARCGVPYQNISPTLHSRVAPSSLGVVTQPHECCWLGSFIFLYSFNELGHPDITTFHMRVSNTRTDSRLALCAFPLPWGCHGESTQHGPHYISFLFAVASSAQRLDMGTDKPFKSYRVSILRI